MDETENQEATTQTKKLPPVNVIINDRDSHNKLKEMLKTVSFEYSLVNKILVNKVAIRVQTEDDFRAV